MTTEKEKVSFADCFQKKNCVICGKEGCKHLTGLPEINSACDNIVSVQPMSESRSNIFRFEYMNTRSLWNRFLNAIKDIIWGKEIVRGCFAFRKRKVKWNKFKRLLKHKK